jgi:hypothetical protein
MGEPGQPAIAVTAEQLADRDAWELRHQQGKCTLEELLMMALRSGAPASAYLIDQLEHAFGNFAYGAFLRENETRPGDLASAFGTVKMADEVQAAEAEIYARSIYSLVHELHTSKRLAKQLPLRRGSGGAFERAAAIVGLSESRVVDLYYAGKKLL